MNFILIKDILNNKEFIYTDNNFDEAVNYLKITYNLDNVNFSIHEQFCEIFREEQVINKGWIWNSTESNKEVIFVLSLIPVLNNNNPHIEQIDTCTQTNFTTVQNTSTQTETLNLSQLELQYRYYNDQDRLFDHFETSVDIFPSRINSDPLGLCRKQEVKQEIKLLDVLTKELKSKLQLPNYGLKNTNYQFNLM